MDVTRDPWSGSKADFPSEASSSGIAQQQDGTETSCLREEQDLET
jgi:hypothetical protein